MTAPGTTEGRGPVNDMWRVDIGGMSVMVRSEAAKDHLEAMRQEMARMKLALECALKVTFNLVSGCSQFDGPHCE